MAEEKAKFRFKGFIIKKSLIEIEDQNNISEDLKVDFQLSGKNYSSEERYELTLKATIVEINNNLNIEVLANASFEYEGGSLSPEEENIYFYTSAPAILFPYIRAHIGTISNLSGINPIMLPTLNLTQKGQELKANTVHI
jgi:preprotein translocase subunit SecB